MKYYLQIIFLHAWSCCRSVAKLCLTLYNPRDYSLQASLSMGFPRQEYSSGLLFPSPGDLFGPGIKPTFPALAGGFFTLSHQGSPELELKKKKQKLKVFKSETETQKGQRKRRLEPKWCKGQSPIMMLWLNVIAKQHNKHIHALGTFKSKITQFCSQNLHFITR